jgi:hypothetical protein
MFNVRKQRDKLPGTLYKEAVEMVRSLHVTRNEEEFNK